MTSRFGGAISALMLVMVTACERPARPVEPPADGVTPTQLTVETATGAGQVWILKTP